MACKCGGKCGENCKCKLKKKEKFLGKCCEVHIVKCADDRIS
jgi:hypothetical protein